MMVDIAGVEANVQLTRYDSGNHGFYDWHTDFAGIAPRRKISISIQLSRPEDYDGGDLELKYGTEPQRLERTRSTLLAFPSFMLHRVTPVGTSHVRLCHYGRKRINPALDPTPTSS